ncbi:pentapeptide repeat-containing protein [Pseudomonas aeruginosa]
MTDEHSSPDIANAEARAADVSATGGQRKPREALAKGNREVITDLYVSKKIENEPKDYAFKVYVRLNAKKQTFLNVSFQHCVFDACYFNNCFFNSCDFTGCRFIGCNLHQSAFSGCKFDYAIFERCQIDDDILEREAPREENLKMRFARSLRMNFQQIGDAKSVNRAISLGLETCTTILQVARLQSTRCDMGQRREYAEATKDDNSNSSNYRFL